MEYSYSNAYRKLYNFECLYWKKEKIKSKDLRFYLKLLGIVEQNKFKEKIET